MDRIRYNNLHHMSMQGYLNC